MKAKKHMHKSFSALKKIEILDELESEACVMETARAYSLNKALVCTVRKKWAKM